MRYVAQFVEPVCVAGRLSTARAQTDDAGSVVATADYDAYGNLRAATGSPNREGWAGDSRDPATGLTHLRARDYDPLTGRFTTADTASPNGAGTQGYDACHYTGNNPTTRTDPSGHSWLDAMPEALRALIGGVVQMVLTLRLVMRSDTIPDWGKQFIATLIVFGLQVVMTALVVMLLVWIKGASSRRAAWATSSAVTWASGWSRTRLRGRDRQPGPLLRHRSLAI